MSSHTFKEILTRHFDFTSDRIKDELRVLKQRLTNIILKDFVDRKVLNELIVDQFLLDTKHYTADVKQNWLEDETSLDSGIQLALQTVKSYLTSGYLQGNLQLPLTTKSAFVKADNLSITNSATKANTTFKENTNIALSVPNNKSCTLSPEPSPSLQGSPSPSVKAEVNIDVNENMPGVWIYQLTWLKHIKMRQLKKKN